MTPIERADRIHDCVQDIYWLARTVPLMRDRLMEIDLHIHKIIEDYERRGMKHADAQTTDEGQTAPAAPAADVGEAEGSLRRSGHLW